MVSYSTQAWEDFCGAGKEFFAVFDELNAPLGKHYFYEITYASGDTYTTNGVAASLKRGGLTKINLVRISVSNGWDIDCEYVASSDKIKMYNSGSELSASTALNGLKLLIEVYGS